MTQQLDTDDWKAYKKIGQDKRAKNREWSTNHLKEKGFKLREHNCGAHIVVLSGNLAPIALADFWPGTGKYKLRGSSTYKRGVKNLVKDLEKL